MGGYMKYFRVLFENHSISTQIEWIGPS